MTSIATPCVSILSRETRGEKPPQFKNGNGKAVGGLAEDRFLEKTGLDYDKHHLHKYHGWATETEHLLQLRELGGRGIRLVLRDGTVLESTLSAWEQHGFRPKGLESNQTVLPDRYWRVVSTREGRQLALAIA